MTTSSHQATYLAQNVALQRRGWSTGGAVAGGGIVLLHSGYWRDAWTTVEIRRSPDTESGWFICAEGRPLEIFTKLAEFFEIVVD